MKPTRFLDSTISISKKLLQSKSRVKLRNKIFSRTIISNGMF